ncbi:hypothetical protein GTZ99_05110 [Novosphingobium sp. FSY-8]|uniref:Uncharacterized protein n=1 Tax=Novosphingobium ovatum TaxID=1908523 RepID=A0ABW9XBQ8_9SPHN|nr:hypothetical protein [Novosphingobium ovatum]NBC35932.1 hypothetical protein [Novosphingobium ovatum]
MSLTLFAIYAAAATATPGPQGIRSVDALPRAVVSTAPCARPAKGRVLGSSSACAGKPTAPGTVDGQTVTDGPTGQSYKWSALRQRWEGVHPVGGSGLGGGSGMGARLGLQQVLNIGGPIMSAATLGLAIDNATKTPQTVSPK